MDKLELIIQEKQAELKGLQAELEDALSETKSPDYETASGIQRIIDGVMQEIERLEKLRSVRPAPYDFQYYLSCLLKDDTQTVLEVWMQIKDSWSDVTIRLLEIRKLKRSHSISCKLQLISPADQHLYREWTTSELKHIAWKPLRDGKTFYYKTRLSSPEQFDTFCQMISLTFLEALASLLGRGQHYFRFK